ncbi:MAG: outer membrane beta-barrel domain-containing protein [Myxococcota bacterium]
MNALKNVLLSSLLIATGTAAPAYAQVDEETERERDRTSSEEREETESLADRIKSVQRKVFIKKKRVEVYPQVLFGLNDAFFQNLIVGGSLAYHISDAFAIEARGGAVANLGETDAVRFVRAETGSLLEEPPELQFHADLDFLWAPIYGKISLFGESILHFDTYVTVGGGAFGTDNRTNPAANVGVGQRYFINRWLTARIEFRNYFFVEEVAGEEDLQTPGFIGISLSAFLPTAFDYEYQ